MAHARRAEHFEMEEGRKYFYGIRTKTNYRKAFPLLLHAARRGYVHAQYLVGYAYRDA
jgi:TPR repeat protein